MATLAGSRFEWLQFDKDGDIDAAGAAHRLNAALSAGGAHDLVIISHGWRNDQNDAWALYSTLWSNTAARLVELGKDPTKYVIAGVSWPAIKFRDSFDLESAAAAHNAAGLGGAAMSVGGGTNDIDLSQSEFREVLDDFVKLLDSDEARDAREKALAFAQDQASADEVVKAAVAAVPTDLPDAEEKRDLNPLQADPGDILGELTAPPLMSVDPEVGQAQGVGDTISNLVAGPKAAAGRLFSYLTYYTMKKRAGRVGASLGRNLLPKINSVNPLRIHLIGHSFGARLVTAAVHAAPNNLASARLHSLALLQGAFSHHALGSAGGGMGAGAFEGAHRKLDGPMVITHTHNDKAVTLAYAIASRLSRDNAKAVGDASDEYGAIGANGALRIENDCVNPPLVLKPGGTYNLTDRKVHNVKADACISGHPDVVNQHVARLIAEVVG